MQTGLLKSVRLQRAAAWIAGRYLDLALRSTRWTIEGEAHLAPFLRSGSVIVALWHERLPVIPALWATARHQHPARQVTALASRHRDGVFIAGVLARFAVRVVHGSSGRTRPDSDRPRDHGGAAGMRGLLGALAAGDAVVITPDGPRGPRRVAAPGVAQLAAVSGAPVLVVAGQMRWRLTLKTWDAMVLPLPFGRGALVCLAPLTVAADEMAVSRMAESRWAALGRIEAALTEAAERADTLCET